MKSIKMIFLMAVIGMMAFTSCSTEKEELTEVKKTELNAKLADLGEGSWYTYEKINGVDYVLVNGLKAKEIISIVEGKCETCRANCTYMFYTGLNGAHLVSCDNGNEYYAQQCSNGKWRVTLHAEIGNSGHWNFPPPLC